MKDLKQLEGLSIEQLEERNEFTAVIIDPEVPGTEPLKCTICRC